MKIYKTAKPLVFQGFSPFSTADLSLICRLNLEADTKRKQKKVTDSLLRNGRGCGRM